MRCEEALQQLNARADGELSAEEVAGLDAHLSECAQCRSEAESVQAVDAELRGAFVGRREAAARLAESVSSMIRASADQAAAHAVQLAPAPQFAWGQLLAGLAAGFLLAVVLFRPWQSRSEAPDLIVANQPVARLAIATGPVEMKPASGVEFFTCPTFSSIQQDSIIRTGPSARCEIAMDDGNALRLDFDTEVTLRKSKVVEVSRGRLCSTSPSGRAGLEIQSGGGKIVGLPAAQLAVACEPHGARVTVIDGTASIEAGQTTLEMGSGKQVRIVAGKVEGNPIWCDTSLETAWVNSLLALRNSEHPELVERVKRLLADLGAAKLSLMYEDELRRLGDDGVPPLLAYLTSTRNTPNVRQRAKAAAIVADVAQPRWIPDLIGLLTDANAEVRFCAARGLDRLTGRDQGLKPEGWQAGPWSSCEGGYKKWSKWWAENRDQYPTARREIPAIESPSF